MRWYRALGLILIPVTLAVGGGFFLSGRTQVVKYVRQPGKTQ
jgi:hypothetical protein